MVTRSQAAALAAPLPGEDPVDLVPMSTQELLEKVKDLERQLEAMKQTTPAESSRPTLPVPTPSAPPVPAIRGPKTPYPDPYTGSQKPTLDFWAAKMQLFFSMHDPASVAGQLGVTYAANYLDGDAFTWFLMTKKGNTAQFADLDALVAGLRKHFEPVDPKGRAWDELRVLTMKGDRVDTYIREFTRLTLLVPDVPEELRIRDFVRGLTPRLAESVVRGFPPTLREAMALATEMAAILRPSPSSGPKPADPRSNPSPGGSPSKKKGGKPRAHCKWCQRDGHTEDVCWQKAAGQPKVKALQQQGN